MKTYLSRISLHKNARGVHCLDTSVGCASGMANETGGCYGDCYAARTAKLYGRDFSKTVLRRFDNHSHAAATVRSINKIDAPFVRIGCSGDPSENWQHCLEILNQIKHCNREIVIITRHWTALSDGQIDALSKMNVCVNTSVSAMDKPEIMNRSLEQHSRIRRAIKSVLRVVSCDFNLENQEGHRMAKIQAELFANPDTLDTVFRPSKANPLVTNGAVRVDKHLFNGRKTLASKSNKKTFTGKCANCTELCGAGMLSGVKYAGRPGVEIQVEFLKKKSVAIASQFQNQ